jgi:hypothetical protein
MREATFSDIPAISGWMERDFGKPEDFTGFFSRPQNVCLIEGDGGAFFVPVAPGVYEVHVALEQRGKAAIELTHRMLDYMRRSRGVQRFVTCVPHDGSKQSRKVRLFTRAMGWKSLGLSDGHELFQSE